MVRFTFTAGTLANLPLESDVGRVEGFWGELMILCENAGLRQKMTTKKTFVLAVFCLCVAEKMPKF